MCPQLFSQIYAAQLFFNRRLSFAGKKGLSAGAGFGVFSIFPAVGKTEDKEDAKNCHCQIYRQITNDSNTDRSNSNCIYKKYISVVFSARVSPDDCSPSKRRRRATLLPPFYLFLFLRGASGKACVVMSTPPPPPKRAFVCGKTAYALAHL